MKVSYLVRDDGACGYYRMTLPHEELGKNGHEIKHIAKGDTAQHIQDCLDCDVFVAARPNEKSMVDFLVDIKQSGKKLVIDFDDDLFNISPYSVHYQDWGTRNIDTVINGKKVPLWEDGRNIDLMQNRARLEYIKVACHEADVVSVTQPELAAVYGNYAETVCLPNCVDLDIWKPLSLKRDENEYRLYWSGGASHYEDWAIIADAIKVVMDKYHHAKLVLMGMKFDGTLKGVDSSRIEYHPWVHTQAYPYKTAILNADISIIPLKDTPFNRCKSEIKMVEQASLGIPSVVSNIPPYSNFYNGKNGVMIDNNSTDGWVEGISYLIDNPIDRWNIGGAARETVMAKYDIKNQYVLWENFYKELIDGN